MRHAGVHRTTRRLKNRSKVNTGTTSSPCSSIEPLSAPAAIEKRVSLEQTLHNYLTRFIFYIPHSKFEFVISWPFQRCVTLDHCVARFIFELNT
jgi:hypothetical protein